MVEGKPTGLSLVTAQSFTTASVFHEATSHRPENGRSALLQTLILFCTGKQTLKAPMLLSGIKENAELITEMNLKCADLLLGS